MERLHRPKSRQSPLSRKRKIKFKSEKIRSYERIFFTCLLNFDKFDRVFHNSVLFTLFF